MSMNDEISVRRECRCCHNTVIKVMMRWWDAFPEHLPGVIVIQAAEITKNKNIWVHMQNAEIKT